MSYRVHPTIARTNPPRTQIIAYAATVSSMFSAVAAQAADSVDAPPNTQFPTIEVIAVTAQQGASLPENLAPYNVQSASSADFDRAQALDVTDYLNRRVAGVGINSAQSNPLQPDVQFRGFTASPLLGGSQGVSVYVDGVRVNEVFGDTVNWDLIPEEAMAQISLLSGANPIFGLNTLGGAILIRTKNGFTDPGSEVEAYAGSFGRSETTVQSGGHAGDWGWYVLANHFEEDGWRDLSNSNATSLLSTLSWHIDDASIDVHLAHAQTKLVGNGAQSVDVLQLAPKSIFTAPDRTQNFYSGVTAQGEFRFDDATSLDATLFARQVNTRSFNGDVSDFDACDDDPSTLCDDGTPVLDQHGAAVSADFDGVNNIGVRKQRSVGASLQLELKQPILHLTNQFVAGVDIDHGRVNYSSVVEPTTLTAFADDPYSLSTGDDSSIQLPNDALAVHIAEANAGIFATDTLSVTDRLALTASTRYNHTHTKIDDVGGNNPDLDGTHGFDRLNPAFGMTYQLDARSNLYAGYSESTRAPTPVELTCASPDAPCKLPNEFIADPDLKQVVARSVEVGLRGTLGTSDATVTHWKLGVFRTRNQDDILFQSTGGAQSNEGFYANVGATLRQGLEASLRGEAFEHRLDWYANYTHLDASFRTAFTENSANHPDTDPDTGLIQVERGDRIPGIPKDAFKIGADFKLTDAASAGTDVIYNASQFLRGDESNKLRPLGGYAVVNARVVYRFTDRCSVFGRADNVFDKRYSNFGLLGDASAIYPTFNDPRFVSPAAPRAGWIGLRLEL